MKTPSEPKSSDENALKQIVTPGTIFAVIAELREAADEMLALAEIQMDAQTIADLHASAECLQRDVIELEKIAASWLAHPPPQV